MALSPFGYFNNFGQVPLAAFDGIFVAPGVTLGSNSAGTILGTGGGQYLDIEGAVVGSNIAVYMSGASTQPGERMLIGPAGYVSSYFNTSIILNGHDTIFENRGTVYGLDGVTINATVALGHSTVINKGIIEVFNFSAIYHTGSEPLTIINSGTITSPHDAFSTQAGSADPGDTVINTGRIIGDFHFAEGNDLYSGAAGHLSGRVFGGAGNDMVIGGSDNDLFDGGTQNDALSGNGGADTLLGQDGNDTLNGGLGNDRLNGGNGNDTLLGGAGKDDLTGGLNNDFFVFNTALNASTNRDVVRDFNHANDTFKLENAVFTKLGAGVHALNPGFFHNGAAASDANDYIVYNRANGFLSYDSDGNGAHAAIAFAVLNNHPVLAANDFLVI